MICNKLFASESGSESAARNFCEFKAASRNRNSLNPFPLSCETFIAPLERNLPRSERARLRGAACR